MTYISNQAIKEIREKIDRLLFDVEYLKNYIERKNEKEKQDL
jgi:hypothetical protein